MDPEEFKAACTLIWGPNAADRELGLMAFLPCNQRNARYFLAGTKEIGPEFEERIVLALMEAVRRRIQDLVD